MRNGNYLPFLIQVLTNGGQMADAIWRFIRIKIFKYQFLSIIINGKSVMKNMIVHEAKMVLSILSLLLLLHAVLPPQLNRISCH